MTKLSPGIKAFRANIRKMKKLGRENEKQHARQVKANIKAHHECMQERSAGATEIKEQRRLEGIARRDAHNAMLRQQRSERLARNEAIKTTSLRIAS